MIISVLSLNIEAVQPIALGLIPTLKFTGRGGSGSQDPHGSTDANGAMNCAFYLPALSIFVFITSVDKSARVCTPTHTRTHSSAMCALSLAPMLCDGSAAAAHNDACARARICRLPVRGRRGWGVGTSTHILHFGEAPRMRPGREQPVSQNLLVCTAALCRL